MILINGVLINTSLATYAKVYKSSDLIRKNRIVVTFINDKELTIDYNDDIKTLECDFETIRLLSQK